MPKTNYYAKHNRNGEIFGPVMKRRTKPVGNFKQIFYNPCCGAGFTVTVDTVTVGLTTSITISEGGFIFIDWGDGLKAVKDNAVGIHTHTYTTEGIYTVRINVTESDDTPIQLMEFIGISGISGLEKFTHLTSLTVSESNLTSLTVPAGITNLSLIASVADEDVLNDILVQLDTNGQEDGNVDLTGNSVPTGAGADAADNLIEKGWTVTVEGG